MEDKDKTAAGATDIKGEDPTPQPTITPDELGEALERNQGSLQQLMPLIANKEGHTPGPMGRIAYVGNLASLPEISGEDSQTNTQEQIGDEGGVAEDPTPRLWQQRPCPQEPALQRPPTSNPHQLQPMFQDALDREMLRPMQPVRQMRLQGLQAREQLRDRVGKQPGCQRQSTGDRGTAGNP